MLSRILSSAVFERTGGKGTGVEDERKERSGGEEEEEAGKGGDAISR